jgi:hypothetical protein
VRAQTRRKKVISNRCLSNQFGSPLSRRRDVITVLLITVSLITDYSRTTPMRAIGSRLSPRGPRDMLEKGVHQARGILNYFLYCRTFSPIGEC